MPVNILNRFGPLSFKSQTNNTENLSINSLLSNFYNPGSNNFSLSQSYYQIENRVGNPNTDTKTINITNPLGAGFINKDNNRPIKFSEFYGSSFFSSSFKVEASTGISTVKIYSPSVIQNNNFLTNNIQDKVYQYTLYSKSDVTIPIADSGWNKVFSYAKSGDNTEQFYNLVNTKAYKLIAKDCLSNAFSSSMFIGTCASSVTDNTTYTYNITAADLLTASSLLLQKINEDKVVNQYTNTKLTDLSNILTNLNNLLQNPNISTFKSSGQLLPTIVYKDNLGYNRTLNFDGLILQKSNVPNGTLGYFYIGLVTATSSGGTNPTFEYAFENTSTFGKITLYIIGTQDSSGTSCTPPPAPTTVGNFPTNISFTGPRCGYLDCGDGYTQPVCNPTSTTQIKHSGSFIITNNNNAEMLATISPTWTKLDGTPLDSLVSTVSFTPTGMFSILANSTKKISIGFGLSDYQNTLQPKTFTAKGSVNLTLPLGYSPQSQNCEILANFDKNSCNISLPLKQTWITPSSWQAVGNQLSCNSNPNSAQIISNPSSTIQVRHSGSFTITNNFIKPITFTFNKNNWQNQNGTTINPLLTPIEMDPDSPITLQPNQSKKISVSFGKANYNNPSQPATVDLRCPFTATTDADFYINPVTENYFYFSSDKNSCVVVNLKTPNWPVSIGLGGDNAINCDCGTSTSPQVCDPTLLTQIKHTGSFIITNNNPDSMTITLNQNWTNNDGSVLNSLLLPIIIDPQSPISIEPYKSKKISIGVGISNYTNESQPKSIDIKNLAVASLPAGYTETSKDVSIRFSSDKDKCKKQVVVPVAPPVVTPVTSNLGCISYNPRMLESWTQIKLRTVVTIAYKTGTSADKTFAKAVVNALPNLGCTLPTSITQDGYSVGINWTLDNEGEQSYACTTGTSGQFSGTYTVVTTNAILGSANFYILFLRKNNNNLDGENYINLCQTGGVSSSGGG